jgi:hypothetical protein
VSSSAEEEEEEEAAEKRRREEGGGRVGVRVCRRARRCGGGASRGRTGMGTVAAEVPVAAVARRVRRVEVFILGLLFRAWLWEWVTQVSNSKSGKDRRVRRGEGKRGSVFERLDHRNEGPKTTTIFAMQIRETKGPGKNIRHPYGHPLPLISPHLAGTNKADTTTEDPAPKHPGPGAH